MTAETVQTGEFAGWQTWPDEPFEHDAAGPFYFKIDDDGPVAAFRAQRKHMNAGGVMHGGCLMTFADSAIFTIARDAMGDSHGVTLTLTGDFLDPAREGQLIEATGEVVRAGGKTIFVAGIVKADGNAVLRFDGIIRKVRGSR